tara:strand:+ start:205 stop:1380 length:1176 start_codon:yes stop_codon:yes gene_type:complete
MTDKNDFLKALGGKSSAKKATKREFPLPMSPSKPLAAKSAVGDVGIEIEVEGRNLPRGMAVVDKTVCPTTSSVWVTHDDGSLRGESAEFVLDPPAVIDEVPNALEFLWGKFNRDGTRINASNRTSTHVHVNVQGMKINEFCSFIVLWLCFESALINVCGPARKSNHFCLSNRDTGGWLVDQVEKALTSGTFAWQQGMKYGALNLTAFTKFGSLEFRPMRTMESVQQLVDWTRILVGLREAAKGQMFKDPSLIPARFSENGADYLFRTICDDAGVSREFVDEVFSHYDDVISFNQDVIDGLRDAQGICYALDWTDWMDKFEEVYIENPFGSTKPKPAPRAPRPLFFNENPAPDNNRDRAAEIFGRIERERQRQREAGRQAAQIIADDFNDDF